MVPRRPSSPGVGSHRGASPRKTLALVVGSDPGAGKVAKADEVGVPIIDEAGFVALLETGKLSG